MAEEKKEPWLNYLALTTIILAVCATLSTFKGGGYSTKSVLSQEQASNQWSYFQSKSLKLYIHETEKDALELELRRIPANETENIDAYKSKIQQYAEKVKTYEKEKDDIKKDAEKLELTRDEAQKHSGVFGKAVIFLQISILLASIAALIKRKYIWYLSMAVGAFGMFLFFDGFFLFI